MADHARSTRTYFIIYAVLMACTYLTWQIAYFDLGAFNIVAALGIAVFKAALVMLFFMHVRETRLAFAVVVGGVFWLGILLALTMSDFLTREWTTYSR